MKISLADKPFQSGFPSQAPYPHLLGEFFLYYPNERHQLAVLRLSAAGFIVYFPH
ncbi:MAG: hypothetical protein KJZ72_14200 [Anaerolineales bacterium]|nr:hypothetical protein [Anaerolineales bacterium]